MATAPARTPGCTAVEAYGTGRSSDALAGKIRLVGYSLHVSRSRIDCYCYVLSAFGTEDIAGEVSPAQVLQRIAGHQGRGALLGVSGVANDPQIAGVAGVTKAIEEFRHWNGRTDRVSIPI